MAFWSMRLFPAQPMTAERMAAMQSGEMRGPFEASGSRRLPTMLLGSAPTVPPSFSDRPPTEATASRLRPFDLDNDTGETYLHAKGDVHAFSRRLASCDRNLLAGNQGSWPQGGRRRCGGNHRGADDAEQ